MNETVDCEATSDCSACLDGDQDLHCVRPFKLSDLTNTDQKPHSENLRKFTTFCTDCFEIVRDGNACLMRIDLVEFVEMSLSSDESSPLLALSSCEREKQRAPQ